MNKTINEVIALLDNKQANNIVLLDMKNQSIMVDYMIVCDANNARLMEALLNYVRDFLDQNHVEYFPITNFKDTDWILIDAKDFVVHIFSSEGRNKYQLEKLWQDTVVSYE